MIQFIQIHALTAYPPANLNRDDLGRPKTAIMGGVERLRISSQSLKRAWRDSDVFKDALSDKIGKRTKLIGHEIYSKLINAGIKEKEASDWVRDLLGHFGGLEKESLNFSQLVHISPLEIANIDKLVQQYIDSHKQPTKEEMKHVMAKQHGAVDIAAFGRMLADHVEYNTEAAIQVAHAITTHRVKIEDDFFTAVDDLNGLNSHSGSAHIGEIEFGSGLFYLYVCIDRDLLKNNLQGDEQLTQQTIAALVEAITKVAPKGKQNTFASRARASYVLVEKGDDQPRSLAVSFFKSIPENGKEGVVADSVKALTDYRNKLNDVYGEAPDSICYDVLAGVGKLSEVIHFAKTE